MQRARHRSLVIAITVLPVLLAGAAAASGATCSIACENAKPGTPQSTWDISGAGDAGIQGFATDISVNRGQTQSLQGQDRPPAPTASTSTAWATTAASAPARSRPSTRRRRCRRPSRPACTTDHRPHRLRQLGGVRHLGRAGRPPCPASTSPSSSAPTTGGASHIFFVVRDDASTSDLLFQTSDTTWQAYNDYGGNSLYVGAAAVGPRLQGQLQPARSTPARRRRPQDFVFNAEYPMVRWLEANGYDVCYTTGVDTDRRGDAASEPQDFLSVGHDEYWSGAAAGQRRGGARRRRQPRLLQRQRGVLEDALGDQHRRRRHRVPHARHLQGDPRQRQDRPAPAVDRHLARPALQPAGRRRPARERAHRHDLHGQRPRNDAIKVPGRRQACASGATPASRPCRRRRRRPWRRHARLRVGRGPRQRLPARPA